MFDRRYFGVAVDQRRSQHRLADVLGMRGNLGNGIEVRAAKDHARIHWSRLEHHQYFLAGVQANPGSADGVF